MKVYNTSRRRKEPLTPARPARATAGAGLALDGGARPSAVLAPGWRSVVEGTLNRALRGLVRAYQLGVSPLLGPRCRHLPTCSEYAAEALASHGSLRGGWLAFRRFVRCHPWGTSGYDPVPPAPGAAGSDRGL